MYILINLCNKKNSLSGIPSQKYMHMCVYIQCIYIYIYIYIYIHTAGKKIFDPLLILYFLTQKLSVYNFNGRFILTLGDSEKILKNAFLQSFKLICILMSRISIWPLRKPWLGTWWQNPCWQSKRSDDSCSWAPGLHTISGGILSHSSLQILSKSLRFRGWRLATRTFSSLHRFSMGLRSGDYLGHSRTLMCFFLSHYFVALAVCFGWLSCWNTHPLPISVPWPW